MPSAGRPYFWLNGSEGLLTGAAPKANREAVVSWEVSSVKPWLVDKASAEERARYSLRYHAFPSHVSMANFILTSVKPENRHFYEVIFGGCRVKPYFDIDSPVATAKASGTGEDTVEAAVFRMAAIAMEVMADISPSNRGGMTAMVFSSSDAVKHSYHVVIDGVCLSSVEDASVFAVKVRQAVWHRRKYPSDVEVHERIDMGVYKSTQSLRTLMSSKFSAPARVKHLVGVVYSSSGVVSYPTTSSVGASNDEVAQWFYKSLVTFTSYLEDGGRLVRIEENIKKEFSRLSAQLSAAEDGNTDVMTEAEVAAVVALAKKAVGASLWHFVVKTTTASDGFIHLKRLRASYCNGCERTHESENPYLTRKAFYCGRGSRIPY